MNAECVLKWRIEISDPKGPDDVLVEAKFPDGWTVVKRDHRFATYFAPNGAPIFDCYLKPGTDDPFAMARFLTPLEIEAHLAKKHEKSDVEELDCRDFLRGGCARGADCKYRHPEGMANSQKPAGASPSMTGAPGGLPAAAVAAPADAASVELCQKYFENAGICPWGTQCRFRHVLVTDEEKAKYKDPALSGANTVVPSAESVEPAAAAAAAPAPTASPDQAVPQAAVEAAAPTSTSA